MIAWSNLVVNRTPVIKDIRQNGYSNSRCLGNFVMKLSENGDGALHPSFPPARHSSICGLGTCAVLLALI